MATAVAPQWKSAPAPVLGNGPLGLGGRRNSPPSASRSPTSSIGQAAGRLSASLVTRECDAGFIHIPLSEAPDGRCEYYSTTHQSWIPAKVTANDDRTGACQIDKKPGVWISPGEQKSRLRVTQAAVERAAKERDREAGMSSRRRSSDSSSTAAVKWRSAPTHSTGTALAGDVGTPSELGEMSNPAPPGFSVPRSSLPSHERPTIFSADTAAMESSIAAAMESDMGRYRCSTSSGSAGSNHHATRASSGGPVTGAIRDVSAAAACDVPASDAWPGFASDVRLGGVDARLSKDLATPIWETIPGSDARVSPFVSSLGGGEAHRSLGPARSTSPRGQMLQATAIGNSAEFPRASVPIWESTTPVWEISQPPTPMSQPPTPAHAGATQPSTPAASPVHSLGTASFPSQNSTPMHLGETKGFNLYDGGLGSETKYVGLQRTVAPAWEAAHSVQRLDSKAAEPSTGSLSGEAHRPVSPFLADLQQQLRSVAKSARETQPASDAGATEPGAANGLVGDAPRLLTAVPRKGTPVWEAEAGGVDLARDPRLKSATPMTTSRDMSRTSGPPRSLGPTGAVAPVASTPAVSSTAYGGGSAVPAATEPGPRLQVPIASAAPASHTAQTRPRSMAEAAPQGAPSIDALRSPVAGAHAPTAAAPAHSVADATFFPHKAGMTMPAQEELTTNGQHGLGAQTAQSSNSGPTVSGPASASLDPRSGKPEHPLPLGDTIAFDEYGRPTIIRQINSDNGAARTIVLNDDGSHRVFGEHTVASLTNSNKDETQCWIDALSCHQLRGLVHEVGQRLLEGSRLYHARLNQLEKMGEHMNYNYFGLTADASDKDLDIAYRKLARKMHPDKNGGTDAAKKRFQQMKERYEAIKKKRNEECGDADSHDSAPIPESDDDEGGVRKLKDRKFKDKDDEEANNAEEDAADKASSIEYDPKDRGSMEKTVGKMLGQLKNVEIQMKVVVKELGRVGSQMPSAFED